MGDRYILELRCDWCGEMNDEVWYAPSSNATDFVCRFCDKPNDIVHDFVAKKPTKVADSRSSTDAHANVSAKSELAKGNSERIDK